MLLNTSFNQNEPIVCSVDEALDCFMRTRMGYVGDWQSHYFETSTGERQRTARIYKLCAE